MTIDERAKQAVAERRLTVAQIDEAKRIGILDQVLDGSLEVFIETAPDHDGELLTEDGTILHSEP